MPQASKELREEMMKQFGGLDCGPVLHFLLSKGWGERDGVLLMPDSVVSARELVCADFLVEEWDFVYI
jgi:hypothetical protein